MFLKKYTSTFLLIFLISTIATAQTNKERGVILSPIQFNHSTHKAFKGEFVSDRIIQNKWDRRSEVDTLELPFFDDFTTTEVYPDPRLWMDSNVFVNSNFALSPPSFGVATFDNLDKTGKPYNSIFSQNIFGASDTLTSLPINLKEYISGGNPVDYQLSDSIYLSFFYQGAGLGDRPEIRDSLVLQFRQNNGLWANVWSVTAIAPAHFKQVMIGITDTSYLWEAFQFRFINYTFAMGNLNHIHLDYVRMNRNRSANDTIVRDVAINTKPWSLLKKYYAMPYDHYLADVANQKGSGHKIGVRNNDNDIINTRFQFEAYHKTQQLAIFPFSSSSRNVFSNSDTSESFNIFDYENLTDTQLITVRNVYKIDPQAGNNTPSLFNSLGNNDEYVRLQKFENFYAYDDGSAEGGIGLNYEGLPPQRGTFALKYDLAKPDTLIGISIMFNRSLENVESRPFNLCIWRRVQVNQLEEDPIYEMPITAPVYKDEINGFHNFIFDTTIILPKGEFFIGWSQIAIFNLNVGYDNNYRMDGVNKRNSNIYFNLIGYWEQVHASIQGAPMIRPLVGRDISLNVEKIKSNKSFNQKLVRLYPNPASDLLNAIELTHSAKDLNYKIRTIEGKILLHDKFQTQTKIDISNLNAGIYLIEFSDGFTIETHKIIKQ